MRGVYTPQYIIIRLLFNFCLFPSAEAWNVAAAEAVASPAAAAAAAAVTAAAAS